MLRIFFIMLVLASFAGCGNFSPRQQEQIDNQKGQIEELKNLANSMNVEVGKLHNTTQIQAQELRNLQQGLLNYSKDNSGIQIFEGDGPLVLVFSLAVIFMLLMYHYYTRSQHAERAVDLMSEEIVRSDNPDLEERVFMAAMRNGLHHQVGPAMVKQQKRYGVY